MVRFQTMTRYLAGATLGLLLTGPATSAMAACTQADAAGSWQIYTFGADDGFSSAWTYCTLTFKPNGVFENSNSVCTASNGVTRSVWGYFRLIGSQGCIFNGYIYISGTRNDVVRATMNRSKDHVNGVGAFPGGQFFFNMTKP